MAGIGSLGRERMAKIMAKNPQVVTSELVSRELDLPKSEANRILTRWCKNGWLTRIKRGSYIFKSLDSVNRPDIIEEPYLIADKLFGPGYIGGFSAVKHWDLSEQIIETTYYFTCKQVKSRSPEYAGTKFKIKTIKPHKLFGTKNVWIENKKIKISDPSKTIADLLDDPKLVGGMEILADILGEYIESEYLDISLLLKYIQEMENKTIYKRLGFLAEVRFKQIAPIIDECKNNISAGYSEFDPLIKGEAIIEKWKLRVPPSWKREYDRKA